MNIEKHAVDVIFLDIDGVLLPYAEKGAPGEGPEQRECDGCASNPELPFYSCDKCGQQHRDCCPSHARNCAECGSQLCGPCYTASACADGSCAATIKRARKEADLSQQPAEHMAGEMSDQDGGSESNENIFPLQQLQALEHVIKETDATIVLSSTWRLEENMIESILDSFAQYGGALKAIRELAVTPAQEGLSRQQEIAAWLASGDAVKLRSWVALDDIDLVQGESNAPLAAHFEKNVVKTAPTVGLTREEAETAVQLLKAQGCVKPAEVVCATMADFINGDY